MSYSEMLFLSALLFLSPFMLPAAETVNGPSERELIQLVERLGAAKASDRRDARKRLKELGGIARQALIQYQDSPDPEIRKSVDDLLNEKDLRWQIIPEAEAEINDLLAALRAGEDGQPQWERLAKLQATEFPQFLLAATKEKDLAEKVSTGIHEYQRFVSPLLMAEQIRQLGDDKQQEFLKLLGLLTYSFRKQQMQVFYALGEDRRAVKLAKEFWLEASAEQAIDIAVIAATRGGFLDDLLAQGRQDILSTAPRSETDACKRMAFYANIAYRCHKPDVVLELIALHPFKDPHPNSLQLLIDVLEKIDADAQINQLLSGQSDPWLMYQMLHRFNSMAGISMQEADWEKVIANVKNHEELWQLAVELTDINLKHSQKAFELIIATDPKETQQDVNAYHRLGVIAENAGRCADAAEYYEKFAAMRALQHERSRPISTWRLRSQEMSLLAETPALPEYAELLAQAQHEVDDGKPTTAVQTLKKAIKVAPQLFQAYRQLLSIARDQEDYKTYNQYVEQLLRHPPPTTADALAMAFRAADGLFLEKAQELLDEFIRQSPMKYNQSYMQGIIAERRGDLKDAYQSFYAIRASYPAVIHRHLGLILLKQRRLTEADRAFSEHLLNSPNDDYARLWQSITRMHRKIDDRADVGAFIAERHLDESQWPTKLLQYYADKMTAEQLLQAASQAEDPLIRNSHLCEAHFYISQVQLTSGQKAAATENLEKVLSFDIRLFIEHVWAHFELELLRRPPASPKPQPVQNQLPPDK